MLSTLSTETDWSLVITDLQAKQQECNSKIGELKELKKSLALESAMGNAEAKSRLATLNAELTKLALDADDFVIAIAAATAELRKAEQAVKDAAEKERQAALSKLAEEAIQKAADYTRALRTAVIAGTEARQALAAMTRLAKPGETTNINRLIDASPYERTAEFLGLRAFIEFRAYTGPQAHLKPLEDEFSALLLRFLPTEDRRE